MGWLIEDTRQQKGKHELKHDYWMRRGANVIRCKLPFGDYARVPEVVVDTKKDIYEIAGNLLHQHKRFREECIAANVAGCQLIVLIENLDGIRDLGDLARWQESLEHLDMRRFKNAKAVRIKGETLAKTMSTMSQKYGVVWDFCTPNEAAKRIDDLLNPAVTFRCPHCGREIER